MIGIEGDGCEIDAEAASLVVEGSRRSELVVCVSSCPPVASASFEPIVDQACVALEMTRLRCRK